MSRQGLAEMRVVSLHAAENMHHCRAAVEEVAASFVPAAGWSDVVSRLSSSVPPTALIVDARVIARDGRATLTALKDRGLLVPTTVYLGGADAVSMSAAWHVPQEIAAPVFSRADLVRFLKACSDTDLRCSLARHLNSCMKGADHVSGLLRVLASIDGSSSWATARIARELRMGRSSLYIRLRDSGVPPLEQIQALFRLIPAVNMLQLGASAEDAAYRAGFSDAASLRKGFRRRLGMSMRELRRRAGWHWVVNQWLERHGAKSDP